ncbi:MULTISPECIES: transcriptional regulator PpsR [Methylobacterium]|nr:MULTISPECIES: transcriptional regulator PpsR [Methylobacterium]PIU04094.1 MAG: transcriptional regulator PpsR [Methylobacterium sp. CG09_land_8_20_14_0_10_71_15]PIU11632.1 MAG: transcriptional regulator PpsR [Methylobacterium sp. CG08_land_8_20_14_0_20_71_15]GBU17627.1 transcriptional regulator PpsR [Methylobacterium sp.]
MSSLAHHATREALAALQTSLGPLDAQAAGALVAAATDLSLVIDGEGVIRDASFASADLKGEGCETWLGRPWIDTVTVESRPKIDALLKDAAPGAVTRWRQVNHLSPTGIDLPVRYAAMRLPGDGQVLLLGRNLRAMASLQRTLVETQQALERDYLRMRDAETRYRLLFQLGSEPVLVVDAGTRRVTDVNPAAARLIGRPEKRIVGQDAVDLFDASSLRDLEILFAGLRVTGQAADLDARLGARRGPVRVAASLFRQDNATSVLLRLAAAEADTAQAEPARAGALDVVRSLPEGFVVTDPERRILTANPAFLDLVQLATEEQVRGQPLDRWLGREQSEVATLLAMLAQHGSVRYFPTHVRGAYGTMEEVEVAAVSATDGSRPCLGFTLRAMPRRAVAASGRRELPRSVEQMTELVGRVPMRNLVRESTDLIERLCIEAALRITQDNRASAAEMLGLSRQGLYAKMRRYGIGDLDAPDGVADSV